MSDRFNVWAATRTLKGKLGRNVGFGIAQRLNPNLTEAEWDAALAQAKAILQNRANELSRSLARRPIAGEITPFRVNHPGGFLQQVEVFVRDRDTGLIDVRPFSFKTDTLRSRINVVKEVWNMFLAGSDADPEAYPEEVLSVAYVGTHELVARTP